MNQKLSKQAKQTPNERQKHTMQQARCICISICIVLLQDNEKKLINLLLCLQKL